MRRHTAAGSVQCLGSIKVEGQDMSALAQSPDLYETLAFLFGDHLLGWEHGDTLHLQVTTRPVVVLSITKP